SLALARRRARFPHLPAESALEHSSPFPVSGSARQYSAQWARRASVAVGIFRSGNPHAASLDSAHLARRPLVLLLLETGQAVSRAGLGMGVHRGRHRDAEPANLLSLFRLSGFVRWGQRDVGRLARPAPIPMAKVRLSRHDG